MKFDHTQKDEENQRLRIGKLFAQYHEREEAVKTGRKIPADGDLTIGTGTYLSAAVMFIDICRSSARPAASKEEQQAVLEIYAIFFSEMIRIVGDYSGHVEKNTGDGILAYFEDSPSSDQGSGALRAIYCAYTMLWANTCVINPIWIARGIDPIAFRISIDYGKITIAQVGARNQFHSRVAIGAPANFAAKIMKNAGADEIVISREVKQYLTLKQQGWCKALDVDTGFVYTATGEKCPVYKYGGRWQKYWDYVNGKVTK